MTIKELKDILFLLSENDILAEEKEIDIEGENGENLGIYGFTVYFDGTFELKVCERE